MTADKKNGDVDHDENEEEKNEVSLQHVMNTDIQCHARKIIENYYPQNTKDSSVKM